jgi:Protein of unknown function (DUF4085)
MIFITRQLYEGTQPGSGWERRAGRQWDRRSEIYERDYEVVSPLLPIAVRRLCGHGLHDARVESASQVGGTLSLTVDATDALGGYRGRRLMLSFSGVRSRIPTRALRRQWWLYEEAHLSSRARFSLHVMFDKSDVEIEADGLEVVRL